MTPRQVNIGSGNGLARQATSHYLNPCWPGSVSSYGMTAIYQELTVLLVIRESLSDEYVTTVATKDLTDIITIWV